MSQQRPLGIPQSFLEPVDGDLLGHPDDFIQITDLESFRALIREDSGIRFFDHDPFVICQYTVALPDIFQTAADLEARGLVFEKATGKLLSRPLHKFFNLGEREGLAILNQAGPWRLDEKRDGSMIGAFFYKGELYFHTRGGVSSQARAALDVAGPGVRALAQTAFDAGMTPIFEWTAPENRVVIPYDRSELTLLALRNRTTGRYDYALAQELCATHDVPHAATLVGGIASANDFIALFDGLAQRTDIEGGVLIGPDGRRLKVKTADYLRRHKILANLGNERYAYEAWIDDVVDDTAAALGGGRARALVDFAAAIENRIRALDEELRAATSDLDPADRKTAAAQVRTRFTGSLQTLAFATLDGTPMRDAVRKLLSLRVAKPEKRALTKTDLGLPDWQPIELITD